MSIIGIALDLLLAGLLMAALLFGWILNRRLKALKDSHAGFADSVATLDRAAQRAEMGLAELRGATEQAADLLAGRIAKARDLADDLDRLTVRGAAVVERQAALTAQQATSQAAVRAAPPSPRALAEQLAAERAQFGGAAPRAVRQPAPMDRAPAERAPIERAPARLAARRVETDRAQAMQYPLTSEEEALAAAESLVLRLSQSEALTEDDRPLRAQRTGPRLSPLAARRPAPQEAIDFDEPQAQPQPAPRPNPRSRAAVDDDLFDPTPRSRLRAFDGGRA